MIGIDVGAHVLSADADLMQRARADRHHCRRDTAPNANRPLTKVRSPALEVGAKESAD
jgi:hypothetical protein